jgi:hypothetical protein
VSIRFKHGIHTIFLFVDLLQTFDDLSATLFQTLRERYPEGKLTTSEGETEIPESDDDVRIAFGKLKSPHDPSKGWQYLRVDGEEHLSKFDLRENAILAFTFRPADEDPEDAEVDFLVDWAQLDDEEEGE